MNTFKCENTDCGHVFRSSNPECCPKCNSIEFSSHHVKSKKKFIIIGFLILLINLSLSYFYILPVYYFNNGKSFLVYQKYTEAIDNFTKAIEINQKYALAYRYRGFAYARSKNQTSKALDDYEKACKYGETICCNWH